jgi:hypothetical protein
MITIRAKLKRVSSKPDSIPRAFVRQSTLGNDLITIFLEAPFFAPTAAANPHLAAGATPATGKARLGNHLPVVFFRHAAASAHIESTPRIHVK